MKQIGIVGLGDMGISMARNIIVHGFSLTGFDLRAERLRLLEDLAGTPAHNVAEVDRQSNSVFVMVLNGGQVHNVVGGADGLAATMKPGATLIVSATIKLRVLTHELDKYERTIGEVYHGDLL